MKSEMNKIKKKRKVSETTEETVEKIKKSKKRDTERSAKASANNVEEETAKMDRKKEKKKKRKLLEIADNVEVKKKPKINGDAVATNETIDNKAGDESALEEPNKNSDCEDDTKVSNKEASKLSGKSLRKSFNSGDGMDALRKFVVVCKENAERDLAAEYLQAGGGVLEVLRLLDGSDKKNVNNAATVFAAMHVVIMKILAEYPQYQSRAEEACRHIINSHLSSVHSMLSSQSNVKHRKIVLRLLASMVSLGGGLPRELLAHLSFHSQVLDTLAQQTKPTDSQSVRTCFVHFVLAFLVDGNVSVIRAMLEKRGMLSCIFSELIYDSHATVHLVLNTVKTYVLENSGISKSTKLRVFSTPVLQSLVGLYNWKGPKNWRGPKGRKQETKNSIVVNPDEKEVAVEAVHDFLITLLTSHRHGVIFHDRCLGTSGIKNNLVITILQSLDRPWEHGKPLDLVVKILIACPDLIRSQINYTEPFLEPRSSKKWISVMRFVGRIIESLDADNCLKPCLSEIPSSQLINAVTVITIPGLVLKNAVLPSLNNSETMIRHEAVVLLTTMLKQTKNFLNVVENNFHDNADFHVFKHSMNDYISKNVPSLEFILKVWSLVLVPEERENVATVPDEIVEFIPKKHDHLIAILDLLEAYREVCPGRMDLGASGDANLEPSILLTGLDRIPEIGTEQLGRMKVKALEFLLDVDSAAFAPNKPLFGETLSFLISLVDEIPTDIDSHSRKTLNMLLTASGMFEGCAEQLEIWINSFAGLKDAAERIEVADWFVRVVENAIKRTEKYLTMIAEAEEIAGEQIVSAARFEDIFNDLSERDSENSEFRVPKMLPSISISPIYCSALEIVKKNPKEIFARHLSRVAILTLHCQIAPGTLIHLTKIVEDLPAKKYLTSWLDDEIPTEIKKPFARTSHVSKLSKILLKNDATTVVDIFEGEKKIVFDYREEKIAISHDLTKYEISTLLRLTMFYLTQFLERGELTEIQFEKYNLCVVALLRLADDVDAEKGSNYAKDSFRTIFMHPVVFRCFSPIFGSEKKIEKTVTKGLLDICRTVVDLTDEKTFVEMSVGLRNKLFAELRSALKKSEIVVDTKNSSILMEFIEILRPNVVDVVDILKSTVDLTDEKFLSADKVSLSIWGIVVPKLVEILARKKNCSGDNDFSTIDVDLAKNIVQRFVRLKIRRNVKMDVWDDSLMKFFTSFPRFIGNVDNNAFNILLQRARNSTTIDLISFLVARNISYVPLFVKHVSNNPKIVTRGDFVFPIILSRQNYKWDNEFLKIIHNEYKQHVVRYFTEPTRENNWSSTNVEATKFLIEHCFDVESCSKACEMVSSNVDKLDDVDANYVKLLVCLFKKSAKLENNEKNCLTKLVQFLVRITASALKKDSKNFEKLDTLCRSICDAIDILKRKDNDFTFEDITKNYSWPQFTRFSLKLGMKNSTNEKKDLPLLKMLIVVFGVAYSDDGNDEYVKTLFEMTTSHSEFVNLMLSSRSEKKDLLGLLWVLIRKNHSTMTSSHIPLYLSSYGATLSENDQLILLILQHYETRKIKFNDYRPYLWGEAAATHYSVKGEADTALWRQPSTSQVLDLLDHEITTETIKNFPIDRNLKPTELVASSRVYDPSFYLPLLTYLMSDNNVVACHKVMQGGGLALIFAACASSSEDTRLAAFTAISRFYFHLEATNSKGKMLCMRIIDALRNGLLNLESSLNKARLSCLVSTFLARASLVTTEPMNVLYGPLQTFLMAKPAMELRTIPELFNLFHSSDVRHTEHRHWILEVIRDGMKTDFDMNLALKCVLFKMILDFYTSVLSDNVTKRLILQIIEATVKIPRAGQVLCRGHGLLPWLSETAANLDPKDAESAKIVVSIIREISESLRRAKDRDSHLQFLLLNVLKSLGPKLSKNTSPTCFAGFAIALSEIVETKSLREFVTREDLENLVDLERRILGNVEEVEDLLRHGVEFVAVRTTVESTSDEISTARMCVKKLITTWWENGPK